jgi:hypothetical protein
LEKEVTTLLFVLLSLAVARITWLITEDHLPIIAKPRQAIVDRKPDGNLAYLVECWWCVSVYVAAGASAFAVWVLGLELDAWNISAHAGVHRIEDWKTFLLLWPALSMTGVAWMSLVDTVQNYGTDD